MAEQLELFCDCDIPASTQKNDVESESITLCSDVHKDAYTQYVEDTFDLHVGDVSTVNIPMTLHLESLKDWHIGVICGASGSGKSTILRKLANGGGQDSHL